MQKTSQRIAVIGGVAAGPAAAAEAKRVDPAADVVLFEAGPDISYGACEIPYFIGGTIEDAATIQLLSPDEFKRKKGVSVRVRTEVTSLSPARQVLRFRDHSTGEELEERFDKFILATGAEAVVPDVEGLDTDNVFKVRTLEDARDLRAAVDRVRRRRSHGHYSDRVVVVGGGYVGVEIASELRSAGHSVMIVQPGGLLLRSYLDESASRRFTEHVSQSLPVRDERVRRLIRDPANRVQGLETNSGERIACSIVAFATGVRPNTRVAVSAGLRLGSTGAVYVNPSMRTSNPHVWACGDCVELTRLPDGRPVHVSLAPAAYRTARIAAHNAASRGRAPDEFSGVTPASAICAFDREIATVGLTLEQARESGLDADSTTIEHTSRVSLLPGARPLFVTLVFERRSRRLLGGQLTGAEGAALRANVLVPIIRSRGKIDELARLDLIYTPPIAPSLDPLYVAARAAIRALDKG